MPSKSKIDLGKLDIWRDIPKGRCAWDRNVYIEWFFNIPIAHLNDLKLVPISIKARAENSKIEDSNKIFIGTCSPGIVDKVEYVYVDQKDLEILESLY